MLILPAIGCITFGTSFADIEVTIPLGASFQSSPFTLSPSVVNIQVNDTVQWENNDTASHTVTTGSPQLGYDGRVDSGPIPSGGTFSHKFDKVGVYSYFCIFHPWMTGLVNVGSGAPVLPLVGISISTDKPSYQPGDTIQVSGQVTTFVPNEQVTVWVTNSQGQGVAANHVETEIGKSFSTSIIPAGKLWIPGEKYNVYAQYGSRSSVAISTIQFGSEAGVNVTQNTSVTSSNNNATISSSQTSYMSSYNKKSADSNDFVTVQTDHRIYNPNDQVMISGSVWSGLFQSVGGAAYLDTVPIINSGGNTITELVDVQVRDSSGTIVSNQETQANNGVYSVSVNMPQDAKGRYTVESMIKTKAGLLGTLDASVLAKLGSSTDLEVINPVEFPISTTVGTYNVEISSNSTVTNLQFKPESKEISFEVGGETGTKGVTSITIPKAVLSGNVQVLIDGSVQSYNSGNVITRSDTSTQTILEINYHHSTHTIEVVGTQAAQPVTVSQTVPEFSSMAPVVLAASILSIIAFSSRVERL